MINKYTKNSIEFLQINNNILDIVFTPLGASIYYIKYNNEMMTLTPIEEKFSNPNLYHGKTIGRVGNRIENGKFIINGKEYSTDLNEGENSLHSGKHGFSNKLFSYEIEEKEEYIKIIFTYLSKDMEGGFPGNVKFVVTYIIKDNEITILFDAKSDKDTLFSVTNHSFFKLGEYTLDSLSLMIKGDRFIHPNEKDLIAMEVRKINDVMNFNEYKIITKNINDPYLTNSRTKGYDHHYFFSEINSAIPQISLKGEKYKMDIYTDFDGCQIYTDNYENDCEFYKCNSKTHKGIAIEPQDGFLNRKILKAFDNYHHFIKYIFYKI